MKGMIRENHWNEIEAAFPGILQYYHTLDKQPETFLDLLRGFLESNTISHNATTTDKVAAKSSVNYLGAFV